MLRIAAVALVLAGALAPSAAAQDQQQPPAHQAHASPDAAAWTWSTDANVFYGYNRQRRKREFVQFSAWESQNWFMVAGEGPWGRGRLTVHSMMSLEPFTIDPLGSPQLYQTGESYNQAPLINYQHPHDLIMALGAVYRVQRSRIAYVFGAHLVGSPALGPTAFMHRESARDNPQVPLSHHFLDSQHISTGVLTAGVEIGQLTVEGSAFRGEEPDEDRLNIETPRLNSWSARIGWRRGPWQAQVSGGLLHEPEWFEPWNVARFTASISYNGNVAARPLDALLAWGQNLEYNGFNNRADGYLLEWNLRATTMTSVYGRTEVMRKQIFGLGGHQKGLNHPHIYSDIEAYTIGGLRDLVAERWGRIGIGADVTAYRTSPDLRLFYGSSHSYHLFLRWRPNRTATAHIH